MIVLMIVSMLLLGSLHTFTTAARHQRTADQQLQARWLATSALSRAVAQLRRNPNYQGEIWNLSTAEVFGAAIEPMADASPTARARATVTIKIEQDASGAWIEATAVLGGNSPRPMRVAKKSPFRPEEIIP